MDVRSGTLQVETSGPRTYDVTDELHRWLVREGLEAGFVSIFCQHTSCSLVIMENADPAARRDLERWLDRLVRADDPDFTHTEEGPDDMPSHIKMALTRTSESIPVREGRLQLGTWQGVFLWEHRRAPHRRRLVLTAMGTFRPHAR